MYSCEEAVGYMVMVVDKEGSVLFDGNTHFHSDIINAYLSEHPNIKREESRENFVRVSITPIHEEDIFTKNKEKWEFAVVDNSIPSWYNKRKEEIQKDCWEVWKKEINRSNLTETKKFFDSIRKINWAEPNGKEEHFWNIYYGKNWGEVLDKACNQVEKFGRDFTWKSNILSPCLIIGNCVIGANADTSDILGVIKQKAGKHLFNFGDHAIEVFWDCLSKEAYRTSRAGLMYSLGSISYWETWKLSQIIDKKKWDADDVKRLGASQFFARSAGTCAKLMMFLIFLKNQKDCNVNKAIEELIEARWEVWKRGYIVLCDLAGSFFVLSNRKQTRTPAPNKGDIV